MKADNDLNRHLLAFGRQCGKSTLLTEEQETGTRLQELINDHVRATGTRLQELINDHVRAVHLRAKVQQDVDDLVKHSPMVKFTQPDRVKYLTVRDGIIDIENGTVGEFSVEYQTPQMSPQFYGMMTRDPTTFPNTNEEAVAMSPDNEGMDERNIEKRYAALMGKKKPKYDRTASDEKALQAAEEKRRQKANRRLAIQSRARHAG